MRSKRQLFHLSAVASILLFFSLSPTAQELPLAPILRTSDTAHHWWSADSRLFTFEFVDADFNLDSDEERWFTYDIHNATTSETNQWPLQPSLTQQELLLSDLAESMRTDQLFSFAAPNGELVAAIGTALDERSMETVNLPDAIGFPQVAVLDRSTNQVVLTDVPIIRNSGPDRFRIQWSEDSQSFTVTDSPTNYVGFTFFYYIGGYMDVGKELRSNDLMVQDIAVNSTTQGEIRTTEIFDLSPDGQQVLLHAGVDVGFMRLLIWDATTNSASIIEGLDTYENKLRWAAFAPDDPHRIRAITKEGLIEYDLTTEEQTILREDLNAERFNQAMFSPDGRYVALIEVIGDYAEEAVYVVPVG